MEIATRMVAILLAEEVTAKVETLCRIFESVH
jgi:hypothetical protein